MTLRIVEEISSHEAVIALHGWLSAAEVVELERAAAAAGRPATFRARPARRPRRRGGTGAAAQREGGALLTGATPYIALLIERTTSADEPRPRDR